MTSPFSVYKINIFNVGNNSHTTDREESWNLIKDKEFNNLEDAKKYVVNQNRIFSDLPLYIVDLKDEAKDKAVEEFCFGENYIHLRKFFLGIPNIKLIKNRQVSQGVKWIVTK